MDNLSISDVSSSEGSHASDQKKLRSKRFKSEKKERKNKPRLEQEEKIMNCIETFLHLRFQHTDIHPTKDPVITFLCRLLAHFLDRDEHELFYNRVFDDLKEKHELNTQCLTKLRGVFNAINKVSPCASFVYVKNKASAGKGKDRLFTIKGSKDDEEYSYALRRVRRARELLKYGAFQYKAEEEDKPEEKQLDWKWIGKPTANKKEDVTDYAAVSNGTTVFRVNDVVTVKPGSKATIAMRPWVARIIQLYDNGEMCMSLRWFWFLNQIIMDSPSCPTENDIDTVVERAKVHYDRMTPCDIFENVWNDKDYVTESPVHDLLDRVFIAHGESKYKDRINTKNVLRCDYNYDRKKMRFVKRTKREMKGDEERLCEHMKDKDSMDVDDGDLDISDIKLGNDYGFITTKDKNHNKKEKLDAEEQSEQEEDKKKPSKKDKSPKADLSESETEIESDKSLEPDSLDPDSVL